MQHALSIFGIVLFGLGLAGVLSVFLGYPLLLWYVSARSGRRMEHSGGELPTASILVAVRNGERLAAEKILNSLSLDFPRDRLEVVLFSDGSSDGTVAAAEPFRGPRVKVLFTEGHIGKASALNRGAAACSGEVLVFSDADALLEKDALGKLLRHYRDPRVGGVCGQRVVTDGAGGMRSAQCRYIQLDSAIKAMESRVGCVTSNDGKLYSIRRALFRPIDPSATDDLYSCLSVVRQGYRFVFEPEARASIRMPSRSPAHEVGRRRRIVTRSLRGIFSMRELLNPLKHGRFAIGLLINKVVRRLLPVCLVLLLCGSVLLAPSSPWISALAFLQVLFYAAALLDPVLGRMAIAHPLKRCTALSFYFFLGNFGTLLGLIDFLRGRRVVGWDPVKVDGALGSTAGAGTLSRGRR